MQRNRQPLILTWADFDRAVEVLACGISSIEGVECIYGLPRGGLPLAVALSHATGLPMVMATQQNPFRGAVVDDIVETGKTLSGLIVEPAHICTWVAKGWTGSGVNYVLRAHPNQWVIFPWERREVWQNEAKSFNLSRYAP
jgi:hypoxanthine phosphoribosyltransferase